MPANWVFLAVPLGVLVIAYLIYEAVMNHREQSYLHAIYDGDRIQQWRCDRKHKKPAAHHGRFFY